MTVVITGEFQEDRLSGRLSKDQNNSMRKSGAPVMASNNKAYRLVDLEKGLDEKNTAYEWCYSSWPIGKNVQLVPTYRPQTFATVADFLTDFLPPELQDTEIVVKATEFTFTSGTLKQYPYVVAVEFDFPPGSGLYPRRAWLTWFSWLRAAWEFLPVAEVCDNALEYLHLGWQMQEFSRDIHYPIYRPSTSGEITLDDIMVLLNKLREGYYNNTDKLQNQSRCVLEEINPNRPSVKIEPRKLVEEPVDNEFADFDGDGWEIPEAEYDYDDADDDDDDDYVEGCDCPRCLEYARRHGLE